MNRYIFGQAYPTLLYVANEEGNLETLTREDLCSLSGDSIRFSDDEYNSLCVAMNNVGGFENLKKIAKETNSGKLDSSTMNLLAGGWTVEDILLGEIDDMYDYFCGDNVYYKVWLDVMERLIPYNFSVRNFFEIPAAMVEILKAYGVECEEGYAKFCWNFIRQSTSHRNHPLCRMNDFNANEAACAICKILNVPYPMVNPKFDCKFAQSVPMQRVYSYADASAR